MAGSRARLADKALGTEKTVLMIRGTHFTLQPLAARALLGSCRSLFGDTVGWEAQRKYD